MFNVNQSASGAIIEKINDKLILRNGIIIENYDPVEGNNIDGSYIFVDDYVNQADDFTIFFTIKHDTTKTSYTNVGFGASRRLFPAYVKIKNDEFVLQKTLSTISSKETITSKYQNKYLMFWFSKRGNNYQLKMGDNGGYITETVSSPIKYKTRELYIDLNYKMQRIGYNPNFYTVNGPEYHKILFLEKKKMAY